MKKLQTYIKERKARDPEFADGYWSSRRCIHPPGAVGYFGIGKNGVEGLGMCW